jgi:hypothetical protein
MVTSPATPDRFPDGAAPRHGRRGRTERRSPRRAGQGPRLVPVAFHREIEGPQQVPSQPAERLSGRHELRLAEGSWLLATGTLACPSCDAPVLPAAAGSSPADPMACGFCAHGGRVRDFLSLAEPTRPARVAVRLVLAR